MGALADLGPVSEGYAVLPVSEAFDWSAVGRELGDGEWYMVAFRSVRRVGADEARLAEYDERAHLEAAGMPGFVHYFKGPAALDGTCLSFCIWTSRAAARAASGQPEHIAAISLLDEMYERYTLEFLRLTGREGTLRFAPYDAPVTGDPLDRAA
jgi:hypothetical protein